MNHIYRSIWSQALGAWIAVSENTKSKGKCSSTQRKLLATGFCKDDLIVITMGILETRGSTNLMKVHKLGTHGFYEVYVE